MRRPQGSQKKPIQALPALTKLTIYMIRTSSTATSHQVTVTSLQVKQPRPYLTIVTGATSGAK